MGAYQDLFINQAETFQTEISLVDTSGVAYNLAEYSVAATAKRSYYQANASFYLTPSSPDPTNGILVLTLDAPTSANIAPGNYVYDILAADPYSTTIRILEGRIFVSPAVTSLSVL